jgi:hypothetical protein
MSPKTENLDRPVWGIAGIAEVVNLTERQAEHLLKRGHLDADHVGRAWVSTPRRLLRRIRGEERPLNSVSAA